VSNDIMTEVDIPQGLEILQSCSHSERKRVHTTTIYSTALDDRLGFRLGGAEGLSPPEHTEHLLVSDFGHLCTSQDADATPTSYTK
jgi:hypothetical protein